jgi:hypothetical protein
MCVSRFEQRNPEANDRYVFVPTLLLCAPEANEEQPAAIYAEQRENHQLHSRPSPLFQAGAEHVNGVLAVLDSEGR